MLEKVARTAMLYDFYGVLLTPKQRKYVELYFEQDLSLGEIAAEFGVSRQAVHDILRRAGQILEDYENRLGLVGRYLEERKVLLELSGRLKLLAGDKSLSAVAAREIGEMRMMVTRLLEEHNAEEE